MVDAYFNEYPNFTNVELPDFVCCAREENTEHAKKAFQKICPKSFLVDNVRPLSCRRKPFCRWSVEFCKEDGSNLPPPGSELKQLLKKLRHLRPANTWLMSKHYSNSCTATIIHAVMCQCCTPADFAPLTSNMFQIKSEPPDIEKFVAAVIYVDDVEQFLSTHCIPN